MNQGPPPPLPPPPAPSLLPSHPSPPSSRQEVSKPIPDTTMQPSPPPPPPLLNTPLSTADPESPPSPPRPVSSWMPTKAQMYEAFKGLRVDEFGREFRPLHMFFYGSLMDPDVLQAILNLPDLPTMQPATITGYRIKMWSIYPTLVPSSSSEGGSVKGMLWETTSDKQIERLAAYETAAYKSEECEAVLTGGEVIKGCRTFCWAGRPDSRELEEDSFDLDWYQRYFKPSVMRRRETSS
ncbi:hypothetical protein HBI70_072990 [Parastagonospora nodorum]|nr:hypothetical protein HBI09_067180 [Parastagonospora nodorum]KAH4805245.1 hypothetical protein HBH61_161730 [Parastagonospora nodorum]KAH4980035.1 hypothetical protein HBI76_190010 [Parastagonospora nodorum]KAH5017394.1 hypothetical protein HBI77_052670 [Parastagonospora nodorum]KAH5281318.1 hypothetical protein HBI70_072990 [Parastagonospora nodorum]